jgi:hypothetical protein
LKDEIKINKLKKNELATPLKPVIFVMNLRLAQ